MERLLIVFGLLLALVSPAVAQIDSRPKVQARFVAERTEVAPGGIVQVALEEVIRPGWHTYWRNPGDAGEPTEIKWTLPAGWKAGPIQWPNPKELPVGPLMDYGYENKVWLLTTLTAPANAKPGATNITAAVSWLVCQEVCIPESTTLSLPIVVALSPAPPYATIADTFAAARAKLPIPFPGAARFAFRNGIALYLGAPASVMSARYFPFDEGVIRNASSQELGRVQNGIVLQLAPGKHAHAAKALAGVVELSQNDGSLHAYTIDARPGFVPAANFAESSSLSFVTALIFALLGGLILNLMPCVLPILAMKALAVASHAGKTGREAAREGWAYGAGAIVTFTGLGMLVVLLRAAGAAVGWGFQLQEPVVVALFALLIFAVGLNLSGLYEVPGIGAGEALSRRGGVAGAFFTGVLAVAVAAPCTAPFMAAALGFALAQSDLVAICVFVALGVGFAAPFVLLAEWPALLRLLPRPGAWMLTFRQLLAFPMYATALWLAWVLSVQSDPGRLLLLLILALALAFALWALGIGQQASGWRRALGFAPLLVFAIAVAALLPRLGVPARSASSATASAIPGEAFTESRLEALRAQGRPVFVNATAAWCVTCMVNDRIALEDARVRAAFEARHVAYLVADWTRRNPEVTALLSSYNRSGVPLYLYFAPGSERGKVLPQILTADDVLAALSGR